MEYSLKVSLIETLKDRPVIIWGARMTGIGLSRFMKINNLPNPLGFVDSDPALQGKILNSIKILSPDKIRELKIENPSLLIVIAVALKEEEIINNIKTLGLSEEDFIVYSTYCKDFYTIDVVGSCNLRCPTCAHGASGMESPMGMMPFEDFQKVVEKAMRESEVISHISLYSWGEPLLHKDLDKMITFLHEKGIAVAISSNLSIKNFDIIEKMLKAKPDYLKISLSGFYPNAYNDTHTGGDIRLVKSNLYKTRYLMDKIDSSTLVDVNYHLYKNNSGINLQRMKELCEELDFSLSTTYSLIMPLERVLSHCKNQSTTEIELLNEKLLVDMDEGISASTGVEIRECPFKQNQVNINWDLSVPVCCLVYNRNQDTIVAHNYLQSTLSQINAQKSEVNLCTECIHFGLPAYNMGFNKETWKWIADSKKCEELL
jgi:organic radical activating enzyme